MNESSSEPSVEGQHPRKPLRVAILGATGSIGTQTLDVIRRNPDLFSVVGLSAHANLELLKRQADEFKPSVVVVTDRSKERDADTLRIGFQCALEFGEQGLIDLVRMPEVDVVVAAVVGFAGLKSVYEALKAGKSVALANKECLVAGGALMTKASRDGGGRIIPIDSEHSSIYQCLRGASCSRAISKIILTASGGPFWSMDKDKFLFIKPEDAVRHPRWDMGKKISVDSATMMNKGLEIIEAHHLFSLPPERIEVLVHPQSIVHGMVEFVDGSVIAALSIPDMRIPISHALSELHQSMYGCHGVNLYCANTGANVLNLSQIGQLTFFEPDNARFPAIPLAYEALSCGESMPIIYNAANEIAVQAFLDGTIRFDQIVPAISEAMEQHNATVVKCVDEIRDIDACGRELASKIMSDFLP